MEVINIRRPTEGLNHMAMLATAMALTHHMLLQLIMGTETWAIQGMEAMQHHNRNVKFR